jgi:hypothetical protein
MIIDAATMLAVFGTCAKPAHIVEGAFLEAEISRSFVNGEEWCGSFLSHDGSPCVAIQCRQCHAIAEGAGVSILQSPNSTPLFEEVEVGAVPKLESSSDCPPHRRFEVSAEVGPPGCDVCLAMQNAGDVPVGIACEAGIKGDDVAAKMVVELGLHTRKFDNSGGNQCRELSDRMGHRHKAVGAFDYKGNMYLPRQVKGSRMEHVQPEAIAPQMDMGVAVTVMEHTYCCSEVVKIYCDSPAKCVWLPRYLHSDNMAGAPSIPEDWALQRSPCGFLEISRGPKPRRA